jgi:hypothetical protein
MVELQRALKYATPMKRWVLCLTFSSIACLPLRVPAACTSPVYSQFDFWVGHWRVTNTHGKLVGYDDVTKRLDGCVVYEEYHDAIHPSLGIGMTGYDEVAVAGIRISWMTAVSSFHWTVRCKTER